MCLQVIIRYLVKVFRVKRLEDITHVRTVQRHSRDGLMSISVFTEVIGNLECIKEKILFRSDYKLDITWKLWIGSCQLKRGIGISQANTSLVEQIHVVRYGFLGETNLSVKCIGDIFLFITYLHLITDIQIRQFPCIYKKEIILWIGTFIDDIVSPCIDFHRFPIDKDTVLYLTDIIVSEERHATIWRDDTLFIIHRKKFQRIDKDFPVDWIYNRNWRKICHVDKSLLSIIFALFIDTNKKPKIFGLRFLYTWIRWLFIKFIEQSVKCFL